MSIAAYKQTVRDTETSRQIERRILSTVTGAMERDGAGYDTATTAERIGILSNGLRTAIADNQRFWIAVREDLADSANALSPDLRAQLISISLWIDRQSTRVMGGEAGVTALVEINHSIMRGLGGQQPRPSGV
ncbi:putative modulator of flagellin synthesis FlaF-like protein [Roseivivax marinus]|jgi:flagellar protein FlaF|uniref:Putative modulator of flagellin synthesis FlaF-like protein n=1 Tax=Roseivivax marinus TaxID=1379903 RepID=W4HFD5_9RHOB|nr:flagellar biosynthesis regulator FlaF [Roseivivax marinus]ETW11462.1 putative modulator of flagellin synthesis FlaF-like protein [Roseivivax marinus]UMA66867.1 flagellar biosynthesis regulator FlaF [Roseivivax marinus]